MFRLHSYVAFLKFWQASGSSSVWCLRQSDGSRPCFWTQSDSRRHVFSAPSNSEHEDDMAVVSNLVWIPPCKRYSAQRRAWPVSPAAPCSPSLAVMLLIPWTACSQTASRVVPVTARSSTHRWRWPAPTPTTTELSLGPRPARHLPLHRPRVAFPHLSHRPRPISIRILPAASLTQTLRPALQGAHTRRDRRIGCVGSMGFPSSWAEILELGRKWCRRARLARCGPPGPGTPSTASSATVVHPAWVTDCSSAKETSVRSRSCYLFFCSCPSSYSSRSVDTRCIAGSCVSPTSNTARRARRQRRHPTSTRVSHWVQPRCHGWPYVTIPRPVWDWYGPSSWFPQGVLCGTRAHSADLSYGCGTQTNSSSCSLCDLSKTGSIITPAH